MTASDRASAGVYADRAGPVLVQGLRQLGFDVPDAVLVADGQPVGDAVAAAVADGVDVVLTTGGTGVGSGDRTPDVVAPLLDRAVPGVAEALRADGVRRGVATSMLSRGVAGVAGATFVVTLPGSVGGCRDALEVLGPVLPHLVQQLRGGGDHEPSGQGHGHGGGGGG